ncbi:MAG: lysophospholipid acyltransferase family protein [Anaerolineales bacterium]
MSTTTESIPRMSPLARPGATVILRLLSDYRMTGLENYPAPPFIVIANHMSYFDGLVAASLSIRSIPVLTAKKYQGMLMGAFIKTFAAPVWIEQEAPDRQALKAALAILKAGHPLAIAPEGTRSKTRQLKAGLEGTAFLVRRAQVPIVPMGIIGTDHVGRALRPRVEGRIGKPFDLPPNGAKGRDALREDTDRLMCALAALLPERYHGHYAGHPYIAEMADLVL